MKEYPHAFNAQISNGLALIQEDSKRVEYLAECVGFRPTAYGLALHEPIRFIEAGKISAAPGDPMNFPPVSHADAQYWNLSSGSAFDGTTLVAGGSLTDGTYYARFNNVGTYDYGTELPHVTGSYTFSATPVWWHPDLNFSVAVHYVALDDSTISFTAFASRNLVPGVPVIAVLPLSIPAGTAKITLTYTLTTIYGAQDVVHEGPILNIDASEFILNAEKEASVVEGNIEGQLFVAPDDTVYGVLRDAVTGSQKLYQVTNLSSPTVVSTIDPITGEGNALPSFSRKLNFVSLHGTWFACNQEGMIFTMVTPSIAATSAVRANAVCRWQDRLVFGGISLNADHQASDAWGKIWSAWLTVRGPADEGLQVITSSTFDDSYIFWTQEGGWEYGLNLCSELGVLGLIPSTSITFLLPIILEGIRAGRMGFLRVREVGTVLGVASVGDQLLVAGDRGMALLSREEVPGLEISFRQRKFGNTGIASPQGIYSDSSGTLLVSDNLVVRRVTSEGMELVGQLRLPSDDYEFIPAGIFPEYRYGGYYIHDNQYCYYLLGDKASMTGSIITSAIVAPTGEYHYLRRNCVSLQYGDIAGDLTYCRLKTNKTDFDLPALKTLRWVSLGYSGFEYAQVRLHSWYNHMQNDPVTTPWILVNKEGTVYFGVTALYFQIEVRYVKELAASLADSRHTVTNLSGSWQLCDNRYIRGMYGNAAQIASNPDQ